MLSKLRQSLGTWTWVAAWAAERNGALYSQWNGSASRQSHQLKFGLFRGHRWLILPRAFPPGTAGSRHCCRPSRGAGSSRPSCRTRCSGRSFAAYRWKCQRPIGSQRQRTPAARSAGTFRSGPIPTASRAAGRRASAAGRAAVAWLSASRRVSPATAPSLEHWSWPARRSWGEDRASRLNS